MEVATLEPGHHLCEKVRPLLREVFPSDDANGVAQLKKTQPTEAFLKNRKEEMKLLTTHCDGLPASESVPDY